MSGDSTRRAGATTTTTAFSISGEQLRKLALSQRGERHFRTSFLPDAVLSLHHACIHTLGSTRAFKIIENQLGIAFIQIVQNVLMPTAG